MCETDGIFYDRGHCGLNEWCTDPATPEKARRGELCSKGTVMLHLYATYVLP